MSFQMREKKKKIILTVMEWNICVAINFIYIHACYFDVKYNYAKKHNYFFP